MCLEVWVTLKGRSERSGAWALGESQRAGAVGLCKERGDWGLARGAGTI